MKHKHRRRSSSSSSGSSSSSSSSSSGDEAKKWAKKEKKRQKKLQKQLKKQGYPAGAMSGGYSQYPGYPGGGGYGMMPGAGGPPMPGGGYPMAGGAGGYPGAMPGQPPAPGFAVGGQYPGYPAQPGQPPYGAQPGFAGQQPGYPGQQPGYPAQQSGYPGQQPGYPGQQAGYPGQQPGFAGQQPGYAGQQPGYQGQQPGYPGQPPFPGQGYPDQAGAYQAGQLAPGYSPSGAPGTSPRHSPCPSPVPAAAPYYNPSAGGQQPYAAQPSDGMGQAAADLNGMGQAAADLSKMSLYGTAEQFTGTVFPANPFDPEADCTALRKAMKGLGTDEKTVIDIIANRSNAQRQQLKTMFKTMYGRDLLHDIESELSGNVEELALGLFSPPTFYDAWSLNKAMSGPGTKDHVLIEILCTRSNAEIIEIVNCYRTKFGRDMEKDIMSETSGHFRRLLVSCCQGNRFELSQPQLQQVLMQGPDCVIDRALAQKEAGELLAAGEGQLGTDESTFLRIIALRHPYQLRATFDEYQRISGKDIEKSISREFSGDIESAFKALVRTIRNRPAYFADRLYKSMKGMGTDDSTLIRIIVSRSEIDLENIKNAMQAEKGKTLAHMIDKDTSGDYRKLLLAIVKDY